MLAFAYLVLFLAVSAALTWWRVANYRHHVEGAPAPLAVRKIRRF